MTEKCRDCQAPLTTDNWYKCDAKSGSHICKKCRLVDSYRWRTQNRDRYNSKRREWRQKNLTRVRLHEQERERKHRLRLWNGKSIYGDKRDYPKDECCELCGRRSKMLGYHHYDDSDLQKGIWICSWCHGFAERFDDGYTARYLALREKACGYFGLTDAILGGIVPA